ncbi:MAG: diguanylate cyclase [Butyricicoccus sp.]|nr:diguanylate cyclase [Butyricicoccus sp.]
MEKILIIDDSPVQAEFLCSILNKDYELTACQTSREGLEQAKTGEYSLILLDVIMPEMDGFTVLRELKSSDVMKYTPVILITSLADVQYEERGLLLGAVDYVTKPFSPVIIKARVNTHIQLHRYQTRFRKQAMVDELTGVFNRRYYDEESVSRWREAARFTLPFSVCMFDIDKFKIYNDTFGHPAGDEVISRVARVASTYFRRATDIFARYGGEEFVAVSMGNDARSTFEFMRSVRQAVEELHIPHDPAVGPYVTISAGGVTVLPREGESPASCLKLADDMLYEAKRLGRNMVVWAGGGEKWTER